MPRLTLLTFLLLTLFPATLPAQIFTQFNLYSSPTPPDHNSNPGAFIQLDSTMYFIAVDTSIAYILWKTDGTVAGTQPIKRLFQGGNTLSFDFIAFNHRLFFHAERSLNDMVYGTELWTSDGTDTGTHMFKDLVPGLSSSDPRDFYIWNGKRWFSAMSASVRRGIWSTDGTFAGTSMINLYEPDDPSQFTAYNGRLYFTASDFSHGEELWSTDGTDTGTHLVTDLRPGSMDANLTGLTVANGLLYFGGNDGDGQ